MGEACNRGAAFYAAMSVIGADGASERRDLASCGMSKSELEQRAEHHAQEAERLLADRLGLINRTIRRALLLLRSTSNRPDGAAASEQHRTRREAPRLRFSRS